MRNQLLRRLHALEQRLPADKEMAKPLLPSWLVDELQIHGVNVDRTGMPDLSGNPNNAARAQGSSSDELRQIDFGLRAER